MCKNCRFVASSTFNKHFIKIKGRFLQFFESFFSKKMNILDVFCLFEQNVADGQVGRLVARHLGECLVQLIGDGFEFLFLMYQLICFECPGRQPPYLLPSSYFSPWKPTNRPLACQPPSEASARISRQTQLSPQPLCA